MEPSRNLGKFQDLLFYKSYWMMLSKITFKLLTQNIGGQVITSSNFKALFLKSIRLKRYQEEILIQTSPKLDNGEFVLIAFVAMNLPKQA